MRTGTARILVALLVLRVVAAPAAARPDPPRPPSHARFIVRVCSWPAQRPQRVTTPALWTRRPVAPQDEPAGDLIASARRSARNRVTASALRDRLVFWDHRTFSPLHLSDCPRC